MSEPFLSEIKIVSFNFPPKGWALCNGQFLPINQNQALFSLLGTTYGGNGQTTFALPDLRGQVPIHVGNSHHVGGKGGQPTVTINQSSMPTHLHQAQAAARRTPRTRRTMRQSPPTRCSGWSITFMAPRRI
jgi:microcystin-dependent protein